MEFQAHMLQWLRSPGKRRIVFLSIALACLFIQPASAPVQAAPIVRVYQSTLTFRSYDWRAALVPTQADDPIYPYPRLDFDRIGAPVDMTTTVVVLETAGTRLTIAPEFGGRILRWFDKRNTREVLYVNPVIKPTRWGYRGWWLAIGGIEWAFPTNEHGLNEWRPWRYRTFSGDTYAGITVFDHEARSGLDVSVTIVLYANDHIGIIPRISNNTRSPQRFQFWMNTMLPYSPELQFELPARQVEIHSTGDAGLPAPGKKMGWPVFNGRDFSRASEWHQYLGIFAAPTTQGHAAVLNPTTGTHVVRTFPVKVARGVKLFLLGDLPSALYTDGDSRYLELWGGYTRTFSEDATLRPGCSISWVEDWTIR